MKANYKSSGTAKSQKANHTSASKKDMKNRNKQVKRAQNARIICNYKKAK